MCIQTVSRDPFKPKPPTPAEELYQKKRRMDAERTQTLVPDDSDPNILEDCVR